MGMPLLTRRRSLLDFSQRDASSQGSANEASSQKVSRSSLHPEDNVSLRRPKSEHGQPKSRLSHELLAHEIISSDHSDGTQTTNRKRFSMMKLRNYSESQLGVKSKEDAKSEVPMPDTGEDDDVGIPSIVRTAPTLDFKAVHQRKELDELEPRGGSRAARQSLFKRSFPRSRIRDGHEHNGADNVRNSTMKHDKPKSSLRWRRGQKHSGLTELLTAVHDAQYDGTAGQSPFDENSRSDLALAVPDPRISDSSQSGGSNVSNPGRTSDQTTDSQAPIAYSTFFKISRRNKNRNSLFPLPAKPSPPVEALTTRSGPTTPRVSTSGLSTHERNAPSSPLNALQRRHTASSPTKSAKKSPFASSPRMATTKSALSFAEPDTTLLREGSLRSRASSNSSPLQPPMRFGLRERASTNGSNDRLSRDMDTPPQFAASGRNSTSTTGRSSLGGLLNLSRLRPGSEPYSPRHSSPGTRSKSNSFAISREALHIPDREEGEAPGKYLERLEAAVPRSTIAGILSKSADTFFQSVLRSYTRRFMFFGEPIDMSLRKFLLEAELPKETQQVDRVIQAFADRYHECNPGIFTAPDQAYIIAFSLMMLHTDAFNKNNKRKMQKQDYIKNTSGQDISPDILGCFYDNICYTPFVHYEEEADVSGDRVLPFKTKKTKLKSATAGSPGKKHSGPVDPYNLLVENKLDTLRPSIKDTIALDDPYNYRGNEPGPDETYLQRAFTHTGVLQIISARSRPAAYEAQLGQAQADTPPADTQAGIVDLKITKVGTLWRKAPKKKKARSPWQEWGAVLTGSQLYLFKNTHWAKGLAHQFNSQQKLGHQRIPVIFKPPLQEFKPDALIKTDNAVALVDATYTRHKHAFTFFRAGGQEEVFLADNEAELNDWLALINYAAAFRAAGVRIRGMVGGNEADARSPDIKRLNSSASTQSASRPPSSKDPASSRVGLSAQLQRQVMAARRQIMVSKISESEAEISDAVKHLEEVTRNARHLFILAPIAPKTRDDVIHAAARADATIKWVRRDIWRLKCHRDVLASDVRLDSSTAADLEELNKVDKVDAPASMIRVVSKASNIRTPPISPVSATKSARPSTTSSRDTFTGRDVFRTSLEPSTPRQDNDVFQIPPLQLEHQQRGSITSAMLSVSSYGNASLSHASSISSMHPATRLESNVLSESGSLPSIVTPTQTIDEAEAERLARASVVSAETSVSNGRIRAGEETAGVTPRADSSKRKGARRSLQRTLRDAHGSVHKHRRGKDSESTIRSTNMEGYESADGTPGLQRGKGRFILHGKQASVVQLDWSEDQMQRRRERMLTDESNGYLTAEQSAAELSDAGPILSPPPSPLVHTFDHGQADSDSEDEIAELADPSVLDAVISPSSEFSRQTDISDDKASTFFFDADEGSDGEVIPTATASVSDTQTPANVDRADAARNGDSVRDK